MTTLDFGNIVSRHRNYFRTGITRSVEWRESQLITSSLRIVWWLREFWSRLCPVMRAVNDCTVQPMIHDLPFGGVGKSGMGKYHGEWGFREHTNARGVLYPVHASIWT